MKTQSLNESIKEEKPNLVQQQTIARLLEGIPPDQYLNIAGACLPKSFIANDFAFPANSATWSDWSWIVKPYTCPADGVEGDGDVELLDMNDVFGILIRVLSSSWLMAKEFLCSIQAVHM